MSWFISSGPVGLELVSDVADRRDHVLVLRAKFRAQPPYVHVDGPGSSEEVVPPHLLKQLLPRVHAAGTLRQEEQELKFFVGQVERATAEPDLISRRIDRKVSDADGACGLHHLGAQ